MTPITAEDIRNKMLAGKTSEARVLLTVAEAGLTGAERAALDRELTRLQREVEGLLARAEVLEQENRIEEARAVYESASRLSADTPAIKTHLKRIDEALLLAWAIKKRGRRLQLSASQMPAGTTKRQFPLLFAGLTGLVVLLVGVVLLRDRPPTSMQVADAPVAQRETTVPVRLPPKTKEPPVATVLPEQQAAVAQTPTPINPEPPPAPMPEPAPTLPRPPDQARLLYTVQAGDSLSLIAARELCNQALWQAIFRMNQDQIADPTKLRPGMELTLEGVENHCRRDH